LAILVNDSSASASELIAGSLKDFGRALIIGSRTYGKGTGQKWIPFTDEKLSDGRTAVEGILRITTFLFVTPSGQHHQKIGVQSDIPIPGLEKGRNETRYDDAIEPRNMNSQLPNPYP